MAIGGNAARIIKTLFAETTFGSLWYSGAITSTMRWLESLAVGVYVFDLTNSPIMVAVFLFLRWAPLVLFGAWVGVIADRISRKAILFGGLVTMFVVSLGLGFLTVLGLVELWHIGIGAFISGVFTSTDYSTRRAMIGEAAVNAADCRIRVRRRWTLRVNMLISILRWKNAARSLCPHALSTAA